MRNYSIKKGKYIKYPIKIINQSLSTKSNQIYFSSSFTSQISTYNCSSWCRNHEINEPNYLIFFFGGGGRGTLCKILSGDVLQTCVVKLAFWYDPFCNAKFSEIWAKIGSNSSIWYTNHLLFQGNFMSPLSSTHWITLVFPYKWHSYIWHKIIFYPFSSAAGNSDMDGDKCKSQGT